MNTNEQKLELFVKGLAAILKVDANLDKIEAEVLKLQDFPTITQGLVDIQGNQIETKSDQHMRGMYNGLECALACVEGGIGNFKEPPHVSERGKEWIEFSDKVLNHIENYTVPQYGDKGSDNVTDYSANDCVLQSRKYAARFGKNQREGQDALDLLKSAHYNCLAWTKLKDAS